MNCLNFFTDLHLPKSATDDPQTTKLRQSGKDAKLTGKYKWGNMKIPSKFLLKKRFPPLIFKWPIIKVNLLHSLLCVRPWWSSVGSYLHPNYSCAKHMLPWWVGFQGIRDHPSQFDKRKGKGSSGITRVPISRGIDNFPRTKFWSSAFHHSPTDLG